MSREDGKTFPNTIAALNNQTVSGGLWKQKKSLFDGHKSNALDILDDITEHGEDLNYATISALADTVKKLIGYMDESCGGIIKTVECEEHNANLPKQDEEKGTDYGKETD